MLRFEYSFWLLPVAFLIMSGCGSDNTDAVVVSGTVYYMGEPVEGALVTFHDMVEFDTEKQPRGVTTPRGTFGLRYKNDEGATIAGAVPGDYVVTIQKLQLKSGASPDETGPVDGQQKKKALITIPDRYTLPTTSPLRVRVVGEEETDEEDSEKKPSAWHANYFELFLAEEGKDPLARP